MPSRTLSLIRCIDSGSLKENEFNSLIELAKLNKVLLGFLRRIKYEGALRALEEDSYRQYINAVATVTYALNGLDYALFKFRKPVEHVSVDIDILIRHEHLLKAVKKFIKVGFRVKVSEPYTVTMVKGKTIVDLYTHPSFAWIIYLDGKGLLEEIETIKINTVDVEAKALTKEAEVVVAAAHAVYKEHIYLLADYYVIRRWLNNKAINLAKKLNAEEAIQTALKLNKQIEQSQTEAPVKLNPTQTVEVLARKFMKDSIFRATSMNIAKVVTRKRAMQQLIQRMKRRAY